MKPLSSYNGTIPTFCESPWSFRIKHASDLTLSQYKYLVLNNSNDNKNY